ncbi:helix-turn-helix domain-containing protein [Devosia rhizoryzae]|uniref:Chromosomal replication initiator DnaA C-terminal domain-containing protein n=1 Tax=Devosia rhizoryzae TaxID=2774137 RepID=A0ABX7C172_9HYPH|nr:helix-turn-helix domain-containing protein [Devosia rhizoryzae]QQR37980.1 hypothetical protein JI748_09200 [Devosia rhizoryzae]
MFAVTSSGSRPSDEDPALFDRSGLDRVIDLVAREYDVSKVLILHHSRCRASAAKARQVAMYLSHVVLGQSLAEVGRAFHRDRTTVSYACGVIEDLRDDRAFDNELDRFEAMLNEEQSRD